MLFKKRLIELTLQEGELSYGEVLTVVREICACRDAKEAAEEPSLFPENNPSPRELHCSPLRQALKTE